MSDAMLYLLNKSLIPINYLATDYSKEFKKKSITVHLSVPQQHLVLSNCATVGRGGNL